MELEEKAQREIQEEGFNTPYWAGFYRSMMAPIIIPTTVRKLVNGDYGDVVDASKKDQLKYVMGTSTGSTLQGLSILGSIVEIPEALLGLAATNVASGLYEGARWGVNKIKKKFFNSFYISL